MSTPPITRRTVAVTLQQAADESPTLARLAQLARASAEQLDAVQPLIPATLRSAVRAGPIDADSWCLLVDSNAAAAKLRQIVPALLQRLRQLGTPVGSIRLKVQTPGR